MNVTITVSKSVEENASVYFEKAKKAKRKIEGAREVVEKQKKLLCGLIKEKEKILEKVRSEKVEKRAKHWFEKFRWFISSEGFLVIGGRDAATNEIVIKKYTEADDVVFHTDMAGSPFFVVKTEGRKVGAITLQEAADATVSFSRAWKMGLLTTNVFYVKPDQVTKEANSGEYLGRGAFMIRGKTKYIQNKINLVVGITGEGLIMAGPVDAVKKQCKKIVTVVQGDDKASQAAKKIKAKLGGELDDIIRVLPSGGFEVISK